MPSLLNSLGWIFIMLCYYIKLCADKLLIALDCSRYYKIGNPFEWMEIISLQGKTNFFKNALAIFNIWGWARQSRPSFCPWYQLLTSPQPHIHNSSFSIYMLHLLCSQLEHQLSPPIPTPFPSEALQKTIHTGVKDVYQSPMSFLVEEIHTPPCPNAISPSSSVMII